eukprot:COSAG01_NODE_1454_length_10256_cov_4.300748_2_plen_85_part_00
MHPVSEHEYENQYRRIRPEKAISDLRHTTGPFSETVEAALLENAEPNIRNEKKVNHIAGIGAVCCMPLQLQTNHNLWPPVHENG